MVCVCLVISHVQLFATPMDCSPPGSSVHGILQPGIREWVAIYFSRGIFSTQGSNRRLLCLSHRQAGFFFFTTNTTWASLVAQLVKNPPATWETPVQSLGWEDPLEKGKATHSSVLA